MVLQHFSGSEALSRDYAYVATVLSNDSSIDGNTVIGQPVSIVYHNEDGKNRKFHGFVSRFEYNEQVEEPVEMTSYNLEIVPWLWFLKHNKDFRIFQEVTTPDIIKQVFQKYDVSDFRLELTESYPSREYCVQYGESDFDFVSRLMEEEGIFYYFEHAKDKHILVICDSPSGYFQLDESDVVYAPIGGAQHKQLTGWKHVYEFRPGKVAQKDYNFKKPSDGLVTDKKGKVKFKRAEALEVFEYPGRYDASDKGDRLTSVRMEELEAEHDHVLGSGAYLSFTPGGKFKIDKHSRKDEEGKFYTITEVYTEFHSNAGFGGGGDEDFRNEFRCIPAQTPFRPTRSTRKPFVEGPQTAIVVTDGQEIVVDDHARIKVQFHWDRYGKQDINSSCWIRVSQTHAGKGWGVVDIPRQGEEVIVSFLDGDPDRPIITGRVYNGDNPVPFGLKGAGDNKKNKTRRGNTTKSYGSGGYNEMTMDDTAGEEQIRIHSQYNMDTTVQNDQTVTVNNDRTKTIANDETNSIGNNRSTDVAVNHTEKVGGDQKIDVGADQKLSVGSKQTISVGSMKNETVGMMSNEMVGIAKTTNVGVANSIIAGAVMNTAVGFSNTEQVGMTKKVLVGNTYSVNVGSSLSLEAGDMIEIKCGASKLKLESGGKVTIEGTEFLFAASGCVKINGSIIDLN